MNPYKRILVPVDGSETSDKALKAALQLAKDSGGQVRAVHALDELAYIAGYEYSAAALEAARGQAKKIQADALAAAKEAGVAADAALADKPGQRLGAAVAEMAAAWNADLIVVGTHGRRGVSRFLLGSGAEQVLRLAPTHVLVIRGDEQ